MIAPITYTDADVDRLTSAAWYPPIAKDAESRRALVEDLRSVALDFLHNHALQTAWSAPDVLRRVRRISQPAKALCQRLDEVPAIFSQLAYHAKRSTEAQALRTIARGDLRLKAAIAVMKDFERWCELSEDAIASSRKGKPAHTADRAIQVLDDDLVRIWGEYWGREPRVSTNPAGAGGPFLRFMVAYHAVLEEKASEDDFKMDSRLRHALRPTAEGLRRRIRQARERAETIRKNMARSGKGQINR